MNLINKKIVVGISGGIAAYKTAELVRLLIKKGAIVRVVMTQSACEFIAPLTLQALSGNPVATTLLDEKAEAGMGHIELAKWADLLVIAPASANLLARMHAGMADDLLTTICLATSAAVAVCPAMNQQMYRHPATTHNLAQLTQKGVRVFGPASGVQACGDEGLGRMLEPSEIVAHIETHFETQDPASSLTKSAECSSLPLEHRSLLKGQTVLITAGPTREMIDPVRYISNQSSGKMGFALAATAQKMGANVILVTGPVSLSSPDNVKRIDVISAEEMLNAVMKEVDKCDIFIGCAAVADYKVAHVASEKIKKSTDEITLALVKNPDILATVANHKPRPYTVGFAAETSNVKDYALAKLARKNIDMIAANDVSSAHLGFNVDDNALEVFWKNDQASLPATNKHDLAIQLLLLIEAQKNHHEKIN